jgi:hypothetical protein
MKKLLIIIGMVVILVLGFLFFEKSQTQIIVVEVTDVDPTVQIEDTSLLLDSTSWYYE